MSQRFARGLAAASSMMVFLGGALGAWPGDPQAPAQQPAAAKGQNPPPKPQPRPQGQPLAVDPALVTVDDGDTVVIHWPGDEETVRILGIDSPETRHDAHKIPYDQSFGLEARAFAQGAFATATKIDLVRSATLDPYGRTLGYLIVNGKNYSVLIVTARLAEETVTFYGDNGLPQLAAEVMAAAKSAGAMPFEPPHVFRKRMRNVVDGPAPAPAAPRP
ncbi:thermonuclease family protein [Paludisphaera mucosa]|uniref:Thermonuclease family protein n=1 Tax=Paludisphaera mucosa TaxID=3030827 RepID=A0ABT6F6J9_9BACT|nr:thermonuclease family protein [Paludisphaera mucosa]MDG3003174.1 thermonuclease family protein [Paludisphaera mucosa]